MIWIKVLKVIISLGIGALFYFLLDDIVNNLTLIEQICIFLNINENDYWIIKLVVKALQFIIAFGITNKEFIFQLYEFIDKKMTSEKQKLPNIKIIPCTVSCVRKTETNYGIKEVSLGNGVFYTYVIANVENNSEHAIISFCINNQKLNRNTIKKEEKNRFVFKICQVDETILEVEHILKLKIEDENGNTFTQCSKIKVDEEKQEAFILHKKKWRKQNG